MKRWFIAALVALSAACSGGSSSDTTAPDSSSGSSGGESSQNDSSQGAETSSQVVSSEAPIAVPLPGIARGSLRPELQELWVGVERALALTPPDPPTTGNENEIASWASGPFTDWIRIRVQATREAEVIAARLADLSAVERGLALALIAFAYEDMAVTARGTPVPEPISSDPTLLAVYAEAIDRALLPIAQYAAVGFEGCAAVFVEADDASWSEWPGFCSTHLADLREVFGRYARPAGESSEP